MESINSNPPILCFGEILWDVLPDGKTLGGAPLNVASHLHQWGYEVYMLSSLGDDEYGREAFSRLKQAGMRTEGISIHKTLPTGQVAVSLDSQKNAQYTIQTPAAWDEISINEALHSKLSQGFYLVYGTLALRSETNLQLLKQLTQEYSPFLCLDINFRPPYNDLKRLAPVMQQTHFLKMNEEELEQLSTPLLNLYPQISPSSEKKSLRQKMKLIAQTYDCKRVCVTLGEKGALYFCNGIWIEGSTPPTRVVDTIGAGDAFMASMVDALISNSDSEPDSILNACAYGAQIAGQRGAQNLF